MIVISMEEYVKSMIENGYWKEGDLEPIKCIHCDSEKFTDSNHLADELDILEFSRICIVCDGQMGHWVYGNWSI